MKPDALVRTLDGLARRVGLVVRYERGRFRGGRCRLDGGQIVVLNRASPPETNAAVLAAALAAAPLDGVFLPPAVRQAIDEARKAQGGKAEDGETVGALDLP